MFCYFFIFIIINLLFFLAVRRVREAKQRAVSMLKSDHFLADANWEMVEKTTEIHDPYRHLTDSVTVSSNTCTPHTHQALFLMHYRCYSVLYFAF